MTEHREAAPDTEVGPDRRRTDDGGYVLMLMGLLLIPLMLFAALGVDVAGWYSRATQLQKAADAASLAGTVWMPNSATAVAAVNASLVNNGITAACPTNGSAGSGTSGTITVTCAYPTSTRVSVTVTDSKAPTFFGNVIGWQQSLTRSATAEYFLPLPLGSPLNYFGGDSSHNTSTSPGSGTLQTSDPPDNPACKASKGYFDATGKYVTTWVGRTPPTVACVWTVGGIDSTRSPNFWAYVEGPGTNAVQGDAFSPLCYSVDDCDSATPTNVQNHSASNPAGYLYVIKPNAAAPTAQITLQIYDASWDCNGSSTGGAGDRSFNGCGSDELFHTRYQVYVQTDPLDSSTRSAVSGCTWDLAGGTALDATYGLKWVTLCTINPTAGYQYLLNVRTSPATGQAAGHGEGGNGYAVQAYTGGSMTTSGNQPAVYAVNDMAMLNNVTTSSTSPTAASFYLAQVAPQYAGRTLDVDLWDPGDVTGSYAKMYIQQPDNVGFTPSGTTPNLTNVTATGCTYYASAAPNTQNGSYGAAVGSQASQHASDFTDGCGVQSTSNSGSSIFNGEWVHIRMPIPDTIKTCVTTALPTSKNSCWWGIKYIFGPKASPTDVTTWKASVEGDPVHLVQ